MFSYMLTSNGRVIVQGNGTSEQCLWTLISSFVVIFESKSQDAVATRYELLMHRLG